MTNLDKTILILEDLVAYPSISSESNLDIINYLANKLESCGAKVDVMTSEKGKAEHQLHGHLREEVTFTLQETIYIPRQK